MNKENIWGWIIGVILLVIFGLLIYFYGFWNNVKALLLSLFVFTIIFMLFDRKKPNLDTTFFEIKIYNYMQLIGPILALIGFIVSYVLMIKK